MAMFVSCGGVGQAGVGAVRRTLQLYKSLMRPASLKSALVEQHKSLSPSLNHNNSRVGLPPPPPASSIFYFAQPTHSLYTH